MARKYAGKKRTKYPYKRYFKAAGQGVHIAYKAYKLATKVARMVNVEYKFSPVDVNALVPNSGTVFPLCLPQQGTAINERDGDSIKLMRMSGRLFIAQNNNAVRTAVRCIVFRGKQEDGHTFVANDILDATRYTAANLFLAPKFYENRFHTKILLDKTYHMSVNGVEEAVADWNIKLFGHCQFDTGTQSVEDGGIYLLVISNEPSNTPRIGLCGKVTYVDN